MTLREATVFSVVKITRNLNNLLRQIFALMIVFSLVVPQNVFANPPADGDGDSTSVELTSDRIDFNKVLTPEKINSIGVPPESIHSLNTTQSFDGMKMDLDVLYGELPAKDADKLVQILKEIEPELREAYQLNPATKFRVLHISDDQQTQKEMNMEIGEILNLLNSIKQTELKQAKIPLSLAERLRKAQKAIFGDITASNIRWGLARTAVNGGSAYITFHYGSHLPIPVAIPLAAVVGVSSGLISVFINKYTTWLENNKPDLVKGVRNKLFSLEMLMFLSPFLVAFQNVDIISPRGLLTLAGLATGTIFLQNIYSRIKKRSPNSAMWFKWNSTEDSFLTLPNLFAQKWDLFSENITKAVLSTYKASSLSTISQGVWEILITTKLRRPALNAAAATDLAEMSERLSGANLFDMTPKEVKKLVNKNADIVKAKYQKPYFYVSVISVAGAVSANAGGYMGNDLITYAGYGILFALGSSGFIKWYRLSKQEKAQKKAEALRESNGTEINTCSRLFAM